MDEAWAGAARRSARAAAAQEMITSGKIDTRPGKVEEWIAALPMADTGASARLVFHALRDLNQATLNDRQRFQILELLREPVLYIAGALQKHYLHQEFPLAPRQQKISGLERELQASMADGYKIIANNLVDLDSGYNTPLAAGAIHRALRYLGRVLLNCYKTYAGAPAQTWKEIHQLYHYAEIRHLHRVPVTDIENWFSSRTDVEDMYKQIVLLAMADPFHLTQEETERIHITLSAWTAHCRVTQTLDSRASGLFGVNLESDEPPRPVSTAQTQSSGVWRIIDAADLTQTLRSLHDSPHDPVRVVAGDARTAMSKTLLQHLMFSWGILPKRRSRRLSSATKVVVTLGLSSTHYFASASAALHGARQPKEALDLLAASREAIFSRCKLRPDRNPADKIKPEFTSRSEFSGRMVEGLQVTERRMLTMRDFLSVEGDAPPAYDAAVVDEIAATPLFDSYECTAVNESNEGTRLRWACLSWEGANAPRMRVGELVSIRGLGGDGTQWIIGVIRWMKKTADAAFEFGIQFLAPAAEAVALRVHAEHGDATGAYQRVLLLPEMPAINRPASLITPALICRRGMAAVLNIGGYELEIMLTTALLNNSYFSQFHFAVIDGAAPARDAAPRMATADNDPEAIWDLI